MSIVFLAYTSREQRHIFYSGNRYTSMTLSGVLIDKSVFDYGYNNVKSVIDCIFEENDINDKTFVTIEEFSVDVEINEPWVKSDLLIDDYLNRSIALYSIYAYGYSGCRISRLGVKRRNTDTLFNKEYDFSWYREVLEHQVNNVNVIRARWSGKFPDLCQGVWYLEVNGEDVSDKIPNRNLPLCTHLEVRIAGYCEIKGCPEGMVGVCENCDGYYNEGMDCCEWVEYNKSWLDEISTDVDVQKEIYKVINQEDFVIGSCGGCD